MTRFPHDQFAKHCLEPLLSPIGQFTPAFKISSEVREVDIYFQPFPQASPPTDLGLLQRCVTRATLFEPFRNPVTPHEICACASKLFELHNDILRTAHRSQQPPPSRDQRPFLWIITPTLSKAIQTEFGANQDLDQWPSGVYFAPPGWKTGLIVIHQLPATPDTLWFRLLGRGKVQTAAIQELTQLPPAHPYRSSLLESLANLRVILESKQSRTTAEQELFMQLSPLYLEKIAAAEQAGEQRGLQEGRIQERREMVVRFLEQKFGTIPAELRGQIDELKPDRLQLLADTLLNLSSVSELSVWLHAD